MTADKAMAVLSPADPLVFARTVNLTPRAIEQPISVDPLGAHIVYFIVRDGRATVCASVGPLADALGTVTVDRMAFAELQVLGFVLGDKTLLTEVRTIPPGATLHPDGRLEPGAAIALTGELDEAGAACSALLDVLSETVRTLEPAMEAHVCGLSSGKDTRLLAALPKQTPGRWHWLNIAGCDDGEATGAAHHARALGLEHFHHVDWGLEAMARADYRYGCKLTGGLWTVSEQGKWRYYFSRYCRDALNLEPNRLGIWSGNLGDGLFGPTLLAGEEKTVWETLSPRLVTTSQFWLQCGLALPLADAFCDTSLAFQANPYPCVVRRPQEHGLLLRLLTRGRQVCTGLAGFQPITPHIFCPYFLPQALEAIFRIDTRLFEQDAIRDGILERCAPGSREPNLKGFVGPDYEPLVREALVDEARACHVLEGLLEPAFLSLLRLGEIPNRLPAGRGREPLPKGMTLRVCDQLLGSIAFLNQLRDDGVAVQL